MISGIFILLLIALVALPAITTANAASGTLGLIISNSPYVLLGVGLMILASSVWGR